MNDRIPGSSYWNPIWHRGWRIFVSGNGRGHDYAFAHDDFDGAPDAGDHRCGAAATIEACKAEIDVYEEELTS